MSSDEGEEEEDGRMKFKEMKTIPKNLAKIIYPFQKK